MMPIPPPIFAGVYSYRRLSALLAGGFLAALPGIFLYNLVSKALREPVGRNEMTVLAIFGLVLGTFFAVGCWLVVAFLRRSRLVLEINEEGVLYARRFVPWSQVKWLGATNNQGCYQLTMGLRDKVFDRQLMIDDGLTREQYQNLTALFQARLSGPHPEVSFGQVFIQPDDSD